MGSCNFNRIKTRRAAVAVSQLFSRRKQLRSLGREEMRNIPQRGKTNALSAFFLRNSLNGYTLKLVEGLSTQKIYPKEEAKYLNAVNGFLSPKIRFIDIFFRKCCVKCRASKYENVVLSISFPSGISSKKFCV